MAPAGLCCCWAAGQATITDQSTQPKSHACTWLEQSPAIAALLAADTHQDGGRYGKEEESKETKGKPQTPFVLANLQPAQSCCGWCPMQKTVRPSPAGTFLDEQEEEKVWVKAHITPAPFQSQLRMHPSSSTLSSRCRLLWRPSTQVSRGKMTSRDTTPG